MIYEALNSTIKSLRPGQIFFPNLDVYTCDNNARPLVAIPTRFPGDVSIKRTSKLDTTEG